MDDQSDLFLQRCSKENCDGRHVHIQMGVPGMPPVAWHVLDAQGCRDVAAQLCELAAAIEAEGLSPKPS